MRAITLILFFILTPTLIIAQECPADFKRPYYKTRAAFCATGEFVADYYDFDKKIKCKDMEVDHLIPLKLAHCAGLKGEKLRAFANDKRNLKFTFWLRNRQKGAKDLSEFSATLPPQMRERVLLDGMEIMADYDIPIDPKLTKSLVAIAKSKNSTFKKSGGISPKDKIKLNGEFTTPKRAIRKTSNAIAKRVRNYAVRETAILPLEQLPLAGLPFALFFIAWDLKDACDTTTDLRNLEKALFPDDDDTALNEKSTEVCGFDAPDPEEILSKMRDTEYLQELSDDLKEQISEKGVDLQLPNLPEIPELPELPELPNLGSLKKLNPFKKTASDE